MTHSTTGTPAPSQGRSTSAYRRLVALIGAGALVASAVLAPVAAQAAPGNPGVPSEPRELFVEPFENNVGPVATRLPDYTGADGTTYTSDPYWVRQDQCNGVLVQYDAATFPPGYCARGATADENARNNVRRLADVLGQVEAGVVGSADRNNPVNGSTADTRQNHATTAWTSNAPGPNNAIVMESSPIALPAAGRFVSGSIDVAEVSCQFRNGENNSRLNLFLVDAGQEIPLAETPIRACTDEGVAYYTSPFVPGSNNWGGGGNYVAAGSYVANRAYLVGATDDSASLRVRDLVGNDQGNDFALDNLRLLDVTPQLDKSFSPTRVPVGEISTLTFTVTNTSELGRKEGWSFTDTLPADLVIADPANTGGTCQAEVTATPGSGAITVGNGLLERGDTSCTITVQVTSESPRGAEASPRVYTNGPDNITDHRGLDMPGEAQVEFYSTEPELTVAKTTTGSGASRVGDTVSYEVVGENIGQQDFGTDNPAVVVDDASGVFDDADLVPGTLRATIDGQPVAAPTREGDRIVWEGPLPAGARVVIAYDVTLKDGGDKRVDNAAFASPEGFDPENPPATPACGDDGASCTTFDLPGLAVTKTADRTVLVAGETITYTFRVENTGRTVLNGVAVNEGEFTGSGELSEVTCPDTIEPLDAGEQVDCTATYTVTQEDVDRGSLENSATATGQPPEGAAVTTPPSRARVESDLAANPDSATTPQNTPVTINVLANDRPGGGGAELDPASVQLQEPADAPEGTELSEDGKTLTIPGVGAYVVNDDGSVTFTPEPQFTGEAPQVPYSVANTDGTRANSTIDVTVTPVAPPVANPDSATTPQNTPVPIDVLDNDTAGGAPLDPASVQLQEPANAPDGTELSEDGKTLTMPGVGTYEVGDDGVVTFTPEPQFTGAAPQVPYSVADTNGTRANSTIDVTVTEVAGPTANPDEDTTDPDTPVTIDVLANDSAGGVPLDRGSVQLGEPVDAPDGTELSEDGKTLTMPGVGTYQVNDDGTVTFTPAPGFSGAVPQVPYSVADTNGTRANSTIDVTVGEPPTSTPPTAAADEETTPQNTPVTVALLANDTEGSSPLDPASVQVQIPSDAPEGSTVSADGKTLTLPGIGVFQVNPDGSATFTPEPQFTGSTPQVPYSVADEDGVRANSTVQVTVTPVDGPAPAPDAETTPQNTPVTIAVLGNDAAGGVPLDPESVQLGEPSDAPDGTVLSDDGKTLTIPGIGEYVVNDDGTVTFTPEPGFTGAAPQVPYSVADTNGTRGTSTIDVTVTPVDGPAPAPDRETTPQDTPVTINVLANDAAGGVPLDPESVQLGEPSDAPEGSVLSADGKTLTMPGVGEYVVNDDGTVTFTPEPGFTGAVPEVPYSVADTNGTRGTSTIDVTVLPAAQPAAQPDAATTPQNTPVTINPLANDTPGDAPLVPGSVVLLPDGLPEGSVVSPDGKQVRIPGVGVYDVAENGTVVFTPEREFTGEAPLVTYRVSDELGNTTTSTIGVTVTPGVGPTAAPDTGSTTQGKPVSVNVLDNDRPGAAPLVPDSVIFTPDGQPLGSVVSEDGKTLTVPDVGEYTIGNDGVITFTPEPGFVGEAPPVTYQVTDENGQTAVATLVITVDPAPTPGPPSPTSPAPSPSSPTSPAPSPSSPAPSPTSPTSPAPGPTSPAEPPAPTTPPRPRTPIADTGTPIELGLIAAALGATLAGAVAMTIGRRKKR